jgi:anaerobic nitric oxide reductase transcription regulator
MDTLDTLVSIALDLTAALKAQDRYERLLEALGRVIPYDAAALLRFDGDAFVPLAARGLAPAAMDRRYVLGDHPRLAIIAQSREPVRFAADEPKPDPFDGLLLGFGAAARRIHACLGCPLYADGRLRGALTADALDPGAFDTLDQEFLGAVGALAGAQMHVADLMEALERTARRQGMIARDLLREAERQRSWQLLGRSAVMERLRQEIRTIAESDLTVLVLGETGAGKEVTVRALHAASSRRDAPLLYLNCATVPETLAESELFGHTKGAFTGAHQERIGKFELAHGGTLFLDEIGELPLSVQPKLLRAIEQGEIERVGSNTPFQVDARLLAATNRDLKSEVQAGRFRADLFHRLNVYPIIVPPLRERVEDIPLLAGHLAERTRRRMGLGVVQISVEALDRLAGYRWPGNVRELENVLCRAILKAVSQAPRGDPVRIAPVHLGEDLGSPPVSQPADLHDVYPAPVGKTLHRAVEEFQRDLIRQAIEQHQGNWAAAARDLGMDRGNLYHLAARLGVRARSRSGDP